MAEKLVPADAFSVAQEIQRIDCAVTEQVAAEHHERYLEFVERSDRWLRPWQIMLYFFVGAFGLKFLMGFVPAETRFAWFLVLVMTATVVIGGMNLTIWRGAYSWGRRQLSGGGMASGAGSDFETEIKLRVAERLLQEYGHEGVKKMVATLRAGSVDLHRDRMSRLGEFALRRAKMGAFSKAMERFEIRVFGVRHYQ